MTRRDANIGRERFSGGPAPAGGPPRTYPPPPGSPATSLPSPAGSITHDEKPWIAGIDGPDPYVDTPNRVTPASGTHTLHQPADAAKPHALSRGGEGGPGKQGTVAEPRTGTIERFAALARFLRRLPRVPVGHRREELELQRALLPLIKSVQRGPRLVAIVSGKGGTGTTTTAAGIALALSANRLD